MTDIKKVAVIGAGTMGGGIAAHAANAGCQVVLLDMAPTVLLPEEHAKGLRLDAPAVRRRIVAGGLDRIKKSKPAALFSPERAAQISIGTIEDNLDMIADADWIVEVIVEQLAPKQALMERIEQVRKPGSIISSNTSGIPIASIAAGRSDDFRQHFLGTHFFNPPRYLYLLEVIPTADTLPDVVRTISGFANQQLGKGVVVCNDRPNFIANRIGTYVGQTRLNYALEHGYSVEEVDSMTGELIGNPRTATFRLNDLVGLDVVAHVSGNLYDAVPDDEERAVFKLPPVVAQMLEQQWLGNKTNIGFYKQARGAAGKEFWPLNMATMQHEAPKKPRFDLIGISRKIDDLAERLRFIMHNADMDRAGQFLRDTTLRTLAYTARRIPEISDSIADVDRAMRWGFNQKLGPFQVWDAIGVRAGVELMQRQQIAIAPWVNDMLGKGVEAFYRAENGRATGVYDPASGDYVDLQMPEGVIVLDDLRAQGNELARNDNASILDLGDGVLCLEFHSKMNTIDPLIADMGRQALGMLTQDRWVGMVIGNQGEHFSAGANLGVLALYVMNRQMDEIARFGAGIQALVMQFRTCPKPIVAAPHARVLGGGVEISFASARRVAAAETYMGLVEAGVGIVPGWGGCKEFVRRRISPHMRAQHVDALPYFQQAFETIALAKVSESAEDAKKLGYLDAADPIVMNRERQIGEAKRNVLELVEEGYHAPPPEGEPVYALGKRGIAASASALHGMRVGGYISEHDEKVARALAFVLSGGDLSSPQWVTEQYLLDLEIEQNGALMLEPKTQERVMAILQTGKPLRN